MMNHNKKEYLFKDLIGQDFAKSYLNAVLEKRKISNAYLFAGPNGVGIKLATIRFLEGIINNGKESIKLRKRIEMNNHPDLLWVEPTYQHQGKLITKSIANKESLNLRSKPQIRLEQIREIGRFLSNKPIESERSMVVIDKAENMLEAASNALLKTLEEPENGILILISSRADKLLQTIHSRCQKIPFYPLNQIQFEQIFEDLGNNLLENKSYQDLLKEKELINLSNGSPGALLENLEIWKEIPENLWSELKNLPKKPIESLALAKEITEKLNIDQQLWLVNWLQNNLWIESQNYEGIKKLEKLRNQLNYFVQPRIAWEIALIELQNTN